MKMQSVDTHKKSEQILISLIREKNTAQKFQQVLSLTQSVIQLSKRAISRANEGMGDNQINVIFIELHYGSELARKFKKCIEKSHEAA